MKNKVKLTQIIAGILMFLAVVISPGKVMATSVPMVTTYYAITPAGGSSSLIGFQLDSIENEVIEVTMNTPLKLNGVSPDFFTNSLAFSPTGELYAWNSRSTDPTPTTGEFAGELYTIDVSTGEITVIGNGGKPYWMNGLTFDSDGNLYGLAGGLYSINTATGARSQIGNTSIGDGHRGLAYDSLNDDLIAWTGQVNKPDQILRIDKTTGTAVNVPINFDLDIGSIGTEFDPISGDLIGLRNGNSIYSVDLGSGNETFLGNLHLDGYNISSNSLASLYRPVVVPEPSSMFLLGSLLAGIGIFRKKTK